MKLEYDNERSFGALGFNVIGLILKNDNLTVYKACKILQAFLKQQ